MARSKRTKKLVVAVVILLAVICAMLLLKTGESTAPGRGWSADLHAADSALLDGMAPATPRRPEIVMLKQDAMTALFAINHINWVVTKILTYNDPAVLEEEYKGLTADALNLRVIKDPELIDVICRMLDVIVEMRIEERERMFLKDELDQGAADALADAVGSVRISGLNPISMLASAVTSVGTAAVNYKKAKRSLQKKFARQNWALDKNRMYYLNELNKELLRDFWAIVQKYPDLPDEYRVSEKNIRLLVDHLKDDDAVKRHEFLVSFEDKFAGFQPYWYHRAAAAYEVAGDARQDVDVRGAVRRDALFSLSKYMEVQVEYGNILRKDSTAAKAAMLWAAMLSEDGCGTDSEYLKAINTIIGNSSPDDWQTACFCAMIALRELGDVNLAEKVLAPAISELDWQRRRRLVDWKDALETRFELNSTEKVEGMLAVGDALYECRTLVANMAKLSDEDYWGQLAKICGDQNASMREKVFCYGAMGYGQALESIKEDLLKMRVYRRNGHYCVSVPFSWVISRGSEMALCVTKGERMKMLEEAGERTIEERNDGNQYVLLDYGDVEKDEGSVLFRARFDRGARDSNLQPVTVSYMLEVTFKNGASGVEMFPVRANFGRWEIGDAFTPSHWSMNGADPDYVVLELSKEE